MPRDNRSRRRSAKPERPPRRPTMRQRSACTITCTPWRRSQVRSSKPFCGPRGRRISPTRSRTAPCGGDRPAGSLSRTGSRTDSSPKRRIRAGTRRSKGERRAGPVTTTRARSAVPTLAESGLRSRASNRALPHHQPARASAIPRAGKRHAGGSTIALNAPATAISATAMDASRPRLAAASPRQSEAANTCGRARSSRFKAQPRLGAARSGRSRSRGSRRAPRAS